jgi:hypothetical protein
MSLSLSETLVEPLDPAAEIDLLWAELGEDAARRFVAPPCRAVDPDDLPQRFHHLLVHRRHLTATLARHYGAEMRLTVLASHRRGSRYTRLIQLAPAGCATAVEHALITIDLDLLPGPTAREVVAAQLPVGQVLIRHAVHTLVAPRWFVQVDPPAVPRLRLASTPPRPRWGEFGNGRRCFGRVGRIFCDGEPAIRMLEIVSGAELHELTPSEEAADSLGQHSQAR